MTNPYALRQDTEDLLRVILQALEDKKAEDVRTIGVGAISSVAEVFVVATGTSQRHASTLAETVIDATKAQSIAPYGSEGLGTGWALIDFSDIVVHLFDRETREYYDLDKLCMDAPEIKLESISETNAAQ